MTNDLRGVLTALSTPFGQDGALDVDTLRLIVDRSIDAGVDGVVAAGSTGEVGALSSEERLLLITTVIEQANGRVPGHRPDRRHLHGRGHPALAGRRKGRR
jgi:4-hydroxy-tetrahydrodipicolinate synthase